jgi:glutathione S-transferase
MTASIQMWDLGPSPNSKKVRLALGYKGLAHERKAVNPTDRAEIIAVSGQPLAPVIKHGDTVIFDSGAILRYLEANVKREPRLFSADYDTMAAIERWEQFAKVELTPPVGAVFGQFFSDKKDPKAAEEANRGYNAAARKLEAALAGREWLVGSTMTAADVVCASWVAQGVLGPKEIAWHPVQAYFASTLKLDPECRSVRGWYDRINRYDAALA